jgi:hypothetical protein
VCLAFERRTQHRNRQHRSAQPSDLPSLLRGVRHRTPRSPSRAVGWSDELTTARAGSSRHSLNTIRSDGILSSVADGADVTHPSERVVRERLESAHGPLIERVWTAADAVASEWDDSETAADAVPATTDRTAVVDSLESRLRADGTPAELLSLLATATDALDCPLAADPVPAPPYLVVTGTGPILRATLPERDDRLVIELRAFEVARGENGPTYRRVTDGDGSSSAGKVSVSLR